MTEDGGSGQALFKMSFPGLCTDLDVSGGENNLTGALAMTAGNAERMLK